MPGPPCSRTIGGPSPATQPRRTPLRTGASKSRRDMHGIVGAMTTSEVWLVRHGETEWSASGRHTGSTDLPLTERGRAAARAVAPALRTHHFAAVLTSPLQRARETCELVGLGDGAEVVDDLREW